MLGLFSSCEEESPFSPNDQGALEKGGNNADSGKVTVMTWNVYVGTDVDIILGAADPFQIPILVAEAYANLYATDFNLRAVAIVDQIAEHQPHLIGLQEISLIRRQSPSDFDLLNGINYSLAQDVEFDYLAILMAELASRGLDYEVAGVIENADVEMPMIVDPNNWLFDDVRLTDYDVVLVRGDVAYSNVVTQNYNAQLVLSSLGIAIPRGFVALDAQVGQMRYRFLTTHLESADDGTRPAQAAELLQYVAGEELPVIMVGDFNTHAPYGEVYNTLTGEFEDAWVHNVLPNEGDGFTAPHDNDLLNTTVNLDRRIDLVLVRTPNPHPGSKPIGPVQATVFGDELQDRTAAGLWPSDHAGVVAKLHLRAAK
jgi:hypothetical protein